MGNLKGKNKETKDTAENKPVKAGSTFEADKGGVFVSKLIAIMKLLKGLKNKEKTEEEK